MVRGILMVLLITAGACSHPGQPWTTETNTASEAREPLNVSYVTTEGAQTREVQQMSVVATVTRIDSAERTVTVRNADGGLVTFHIADAVKRLNDIRIGDKVVFEYEKLIAYEIRKPTLEEQNAPLISVGGDVEASPKELPGRKAVKMLRSVVDVVALDPEKQRVTVKDRVGALIMVQSINPDLFRRLKVGDTVIAEYTEAMGVRIER